MSELSQQDANALTERRKRRDGKATEEAVREEYDGVPTKLAETDEEAYEVLSHAIIPSGVTSAQLFYRNRRAQGDSVIDALQCVLEFVIGLYEASNGGK